jgi:hypothetical protein
VAAELPVKAHGTQLAGPAKRKDLQLPFAGGPGDLFLVFPVDGAVLRSRFKLNFRGSLFCERDNFTALCELAPKKPCDQPRLKPYHRSVRSWTAPAVKHDPDGADPGASEELRKRTTPANHPFRQLDTGSPKDGKKIAKMDLKKAPCPTTLNELRSTPRWHDTPG